MLVSGAQQSNSYIYIYIFLLRYFSITGSKYYFYYFLRIQDHNNERVSKLHMEEIVHWQHSVTHQTFFFEHLLQITHLSMNRWGPHVELLKCPSPNRKDLHAPWKKKWKETSISFLLPVLKTLSRCVIKPGNYIPPDSHCSDMTCSIWQINQDLYDLIHRGWKCIEETDLLNA